MKKIGIIGMGIRGKMYANFIKQNSSVVEIGAVSEFNDETRKIVEEQFSVKAFKDYKEMLDTVELDAVIIALPDFLHKEAVLYAAKKKLDMMVEKPFSTSVDECREMVKAIEDNKVKCLIAFENRWSIPFINAKASIDNGEAGDILNMNARMNNAILVPTQMLYWAKDSTPAWFLFPHLVDMACWLNGKKAKKVYAVGTKKKLVSMGYNTYDAVQATVTFEDDTNATFTSSWVLQNSLPAVADQKFEIIGEKKAFYINPFEQMSVSVGETYAFPRILGTPINGRLAGPPYYMFEHFVDVLVNGVTPSADHHAGLLNTQIIDAMHKSMVTGQPVELA